jgi:DnaK suppressor protein
MIDMALERIDAGTYGYCEATDDPIGLARLEANPVALYCLAVQEELENNPQALIAEAC